MSGYREYDDESDADDEYERSMKSPALQGAYPASPTESDGPSAENTPTTYDRGAPFPSPTGLITKWSADQCADFMANMGFEKYADAIAEEEINGSALVELGHEELKDLGIVSVGHRLTILKNVYEVKIKQNVPILPDHYVPLSADANAPDAHATQDDVARIIHQIKLRDERLFATEEELRALREELSRVLEDARRLREDVLPVIRMAKDKNQPLPTPEGFSHTDSSMPSPQGTGYVDPSRSTAGLSRKFSTKKLFLGNSGKMPSPTIHESSTLDPSAAAKAASSQLTASMSSSSQPSPRSPTSPPYQTPGYRNALSSRFAASGDDSYSRRMTTATTKTAALANPSEEWKGDKPDGGRKQREDPTANAMDFMKSFRVSMDEPCEKVLPIALKKYKIYDDWRQYSLYIVHSDQERCLGLDEKPLILFKQLASEGKKPMFMLRKHATPDNVDRGDGGNGGSAGAGSVGGNAPGRMSYAASTVQLPGGVL